MLRCFIDDTGNDPKVFAFNFAGWVANVEEWERFSDAWRSELNRKPSIKYFKHNEAKGQTGEFTGWQPADCDRKMLSLAQVIAKHEVYGVVTGIRHAVVAALLKHSVASPKELRSVLHFSRPYDWCFHSITTMVLQYQVNLATGEPVDFIFDEGDSAFEDCSRLYRQLKTILPPAMKAIAGCVSEGNDKTLMPLQAADLLAGQSTVKLRGNQVMEEPHRLLARTKKILFYPIRWNDPFLIGFVHTIQRLNIIWSSKILEKHKKKRE